jgi:Uma2 family endonuclease
VNEFFELRDGDHNHRYEYIDGEIYMMTGGKPVHALIGANVCRILGNLLQDKPCLVFNSDACVQLSEERYVCPDATVSCDRRDQDDEAAFIRYPSFLVEVLSPGTKAHDQGVKAQLYQEYPTIQEFLLIDSESTRVQLYRRDSASRDLWSIHMLNLESIVELESLGVHFSVAEIYEKTRFTR